MRLPFHLSIAVLALAVSLSARAPHGGVFPPPGASGGGGTWGGPGDTVPAGPAGSPPTKGGPIPAGAPESGGGTARPRPPHGQPGTGTPAGPTPGPGADEPQSPGTGLGMDSDLSSWTYWWEFNKHGLLAVKAHIYSGSSDSGLKGFYLGRGLRREEDREAHRPSLLTLRTQVVPALLEALAADDSNEIVAATLIALAKIGEDGEAADALELTRVLAPFLEHPNQQVAETAVIALGILGRESPAMLLSHIALDDEEGRRSVGRSSIPTRTRAFATYALGLIGSQTASEDVRRFIVGRLARVLESDTTASPDLGVAAVLAFGLVPLDWRDKPLESSRGTSWPASAWREAQVAHLLGLLRDQDLHDLVRAHVPTSLARLLQDTDRPTRESLLKTVVAELLSFLEARRRQDSRHMTRSVILALGELADADADPLDARARTAIFEGKTVRSDPSALRFALIAAGRIAGRPGSGEPTGTQELRRRLQDEVIQGTSQTRPWAALGLGLLEGGVARRGEIPPDTALSGLRVRYLTAPADERGALALASGLARDLKAAPALLGTIGQAGQASILGYAALGLGLLEEQRAKRDLQRLLAHSTYRPALLDRTSTALTLLRDPVAPVMLANRLRDAGSQASQAALAQALGRTSSVDAIAPLVHMLRDDSLTGRARAFAAVALGTVADKDLFPWNTALGTSLNYLAAPATLYDQTGNGILNLL